MLHGAHPHPQFLSPEDANRELPLPGDDELNQFLDDHAHLLGPGGFDNPIVLQDNQLPIGFVPLAGPTVSMHMRSDTPRLNDDYASAPGMGLGLSYPSRSSTAFEVERNSAASPTPSTRFRRRMMSLGSAASPAPLGRPISIFSDSGSG